MNELVSIIMPSYNTASYIAESIKSVLSQTYKNWELIIVDDCSTDNTDEIVASYTKADDKIKYIKNETNSGAAVSRNKALKIAKGRWIAFLDSDDLWEPSKLEKQIEFMVLNDYSFTCTARDTIDEGSKPLGEITKSPRKVGKTGMHLYCWPGCLGTMYDSSVVGLIQIEDLKKNNDYAMWLKVIKKCNFYGFNEVLAHYRVRKKSISHDNLMKLIKSHYELFRVGEHMNPISSIIFTVCNMVFGIIKKLVYVRKEKQL